MQTQELAQTFTYTAKRDSYMAMVGIFAFLLLLESLVFALLIFLIHNDFFRILLICGWVGLSGYVIFGFLLAPLRTKHRLTDDYLVIHYGLDKLEIPRNTIVAAQPVHQTLELFQNVRAQNQKQKRRIVASFSDHGQVMLHLDQPYSYRVDTATGLADRILINLDDREAFLVALNLTQTPHEADKRPAHQPATFFAPVSQIIPIRSDTDITIQTENLSRRFGNFTAVDNLNLTVYSGEIYGFLGANGAGKTTSMKMIVGLLEPTTGRATIHGHDVWTNPLEAKGALGYVPDRTLLYERLSGREFLMFLAQLRGLPIAFAKQEIAELLDLLELTDHAERPASAYSFGMKRKLALAGALLHQPPVLILDEPLNGLDPRSARRLKDFLVDLAAKGRTIFLSTHDLATAESICHRVGIINGGRLLAEGSAEELRHLAAAPDLESVFMSLTAEQLEPMS